MLNIAVIMMMLKILYIENYIQNYGSKETEAFTCSQIYTHKHIFSYTDSHIHIYMRIDTCLIKHTHALVCKSIYASTYKYHPYNICANK